MFSSLHFWTIALLPLLPDFICAQSSPYCQPTTSKKKDIPSLPDKFYLGLEQTASGAATFAGSVIFLRESYDKNRNQLSIVVSQALQQTQNILDFSSSHLFSIYSGSDSSSCESHLCTTDECKDMLGALDPEMSQVNLSSHRIFSGFHLFGIDDDHTPIYIGEEVLNGVSVDRWDICEPDGATNRSVYWTVKEWGTPSGSREPVSVTVTKAPAGQPSIFTTSVAWYQPNYVDAQSFLIPEGIICKDWKSENIFPETPAWATAFHFRSEVLESIDQNLGRTQEWFDVSEGLYRIDHEQKREAGGIAMTEIIDKSQGQLYLIAGNVCTRNKLTTATFDILSSAAASTPLLLASPDRNQLSDFFGYKETKYLYIGEHKTRNIDAWIWEGQRDIQNGVGSNFTALCRWNFAAHEDDDDLDTVPVKRDLVLLENGETDEGTIGRGTRIHHLIYDFRYMAEGEMDPEVFDLTSCFNTDSWLHLMIQISDGGQIGVKEPGPDFYRLWRKVLSQHAQLSLLGISGLEIHKVDKTFWLQFKLLPVNATKDSAAINIMGDWDSTLARGILTEARRKLQTAVNAQQVSITYQKMTLSAVSGSLQDVVITCPELSTVPSTVSSPTEPQTSPTASSEKTEQLFSRGVAAAVGFSFTLLGFGVASSGTYLYSKRLCPWQRV